MKVKTNLIIHTYRTY